LPEKTRKESFRRVLIERKIFLNRNKIAIVSHHPPPKQKQNNNHLCSTKTTPEQQNRLKAKQ
jgi:hypothetical protein